MKFIHWKREERKKQQSPVVPCPCPCPVTSISPGPKLIKTMWGKGNSSSSFSFIFFSLIFFLVFDCFFFRQQEKLTLASSKVGYGSSKTRGNSRSGRSANATKRDEKRAMRKNKEKEKRREEKRRKEKENKTISAANRRVFSFNKPTNRAKAHSFINRIGGSDQIVDNSTASWLWRQTLKKQQQLRAAAGQAKIGLLGCFKGLRGVSAG